MSPCAIATGGAWRFSSARTTPCAMRKSGWRQLSERPLAPLVIVDGAGHAPPGLWTATTRLLQTADVPAATAWRAAAAGLAGDAKRWALAVRGERDDGNERTLAFAKAVRDLHYAGLVASKRGRFSAVTT